MTKAQSADRTTEPETMTPKQRKAEIASILALGLVRASSLFKSQPKEVSESSPEGLEDPEAADLSVTALGPIGGPKPKPEPSKGGTRDRNDRSRDR